MKLKTHQTKYKKSISEDDCKLKFNFSCVTPETVSTVIKFVFCVFVLCLVSF